MGKTGVRYLKTARVCTEYGGGVPVKTYAQLRDERRALRILQGHGVREVGHPNGECYDRPLPRGLFLTVRGDAATPEADYDSRLDTDAAYDPDHRARGLGWILRKEDGLEVRESWGDFSGVGNNCAEISAIVGGLVRARAEACRRVLIRTDSRLASHVLARVNTPRLPRVIEVAHVALGLLDSFEAVAVRWTPERELREVDRLSRMFFRGPHALEPGPTTASFTQFKAGRSKSRGVPPKELIGWREGWVRFP